MTTLLTFFLGLCQNGTNVLIQQTPKPKPGPIHCDHRLTTGSLPLAASPASSLFWTNARFDLKLLGKALGEEYVLVGKFSYATPKQKGTISLISPFTPSMFLFTRMRTYKKQVQAVHIGYMQSHFDHPLASPRACRMPGRRVMNRFDGRILW